MRLRAFTLRYPILQKDACTASGRTSSQSKAVSSASPKPPKSLPPRVRTARVRPSTFPVAGDQEGKDTLNCVLADFKAYLLFLKSVSPSP